MVSIVVSWRDRQELHQALPALLATVEGLGGELLVVNFGGDPGFFREQVGTHRGRLAAIEVSDQRYFNKSSAHNLGIRHTRHALVFFCDCDIVLAEGSVAALAARLEAQPGTFGTLAGVRESSRNARGAGHVTCFGYELRIRTADGRFLRIVDNEEDADDGTRQAPGLLMARRADLLRINGYNSRLIGWGWEDQDMIARLTLGAGLERISEGHAVHLSHDDEARVAHYPIADRWESRDRMFRQALANYDRADFRGTYDADCERLPARRWLA